MPYYGEPEKKARHELINPALEKAGWVVQNYKTANPRSAKGVAIEYFQLPKAGEADYVLFVNGSACGIIEAKKTGETLIGKEPQTKGYAEGFPADFRCVDNPLPFRYESSGTETRFTNNWDPVPRSRFVFSFHTPETFEKWIEDKKNTFRKRLTELPELDGKGLWEVQKKAIVNLESSFKQAKPRALIQMATGSGKTFTAVNICYRLLAHAKAKKILFLVDRANLGKQTEQEFEKFWTKEGRKFTELYNVHRLQTNAILDSDHVCISTIQRVYSMLKGEKQLDPALEEKSEYEQDFSVKAAPVEYNDKFPIEMFDVIIIDECHRSIYKLWKQVLDYFDAFLVGLTATPSKSTIGFFNNNLVMEYSHDEAVADQVNVDFQVYTIRTKITEDGSKINAGETVQKRDKRTRRKRWETLEDDVSYEGTDLDRAVVAKDQIRRVVRTFKEKLFTEIFPRRKHVPKTLIYAKDDNHAEEIVDIVREEFNEGNDFCVKITYKTEGEKPDNLITFFRNKFYPRIAVTVDMIATGTDIKPLEIVFFMRSVKSRTYFEQMKGRGVRVIRNDDFKSVTPDGDAKEHFVIVDAVGVTESEDLSDTRPLEQKPKIGFEKLLKMLQYGKPSVENISSMASRLSRLHKKLTDKQVDEIKQLTGGKTLADFAKDFVVAIDTDRIYEEAKTKFSEGDYVEYKPTKKQLEEIAQNRMENALDDFINNSGFLKRLPEIKSEAEQILDDVSIDEVRQAGFSPIATEKAKTIIKSFKEFIEKNKEELTALQVFYNNGRLYWKDLRELSDKIKAPPYSLTPSRIWQAYKQLEKSKVKGGANGRVTDLISILKYELGKSPDIEPFIDTVDKRFSSWLLRQRSQGVEFNQEQLRWLEAIKNHVANSIEITTDDFELAPFDQMGGLGRAAKVFGDKFNTILKDLGEMSV
ncbi:DEAD/DEAH box helicase family protein [Candidatus Woesearchaeota archaeon]|nr:DEAD/DEAH box helicase family protein [Candidatus Woesearchaeota archaeon]